ncbi:MAG TPA: dTMP kinase [Chromatiales bacterium]|nr:dTMP kinase [Chromatiales bacterium]
MTGKFITVEGIEGVGKSTNLAFIEQWLRARGIDVVVTREPGGTKLAEAIRGLLLESPPGSVPDMAELLLMFAARASHLHELIVPSLQAGRWVVCDRFTDASYAYQGAGRGLGDAPVATLEALVQGELRPDLTLLLDASPDSTVSRRANRGTDDRFEQEDRVFFERVRAAYLQRAAAEPGRIKCVNASRPLAEVQQQIGQLLAELLDGRNL